jgi:hypothetical protein
MNGVARIRSGLTPQEAAGHPSLRQDTAPWQDSNHLCFRCGTATASPLRRTRPQRASPGGGWANVLDGETEANEHT